MATCHSLRHIKGSIVGDPLDVKMFSFTGWAFQESTSPSGNQDREEGYNLSPRIARGSFVVSPEGEGHKYSTKVSDLLTYHSIWI